MNTSSNKKGFTLIELLVVISIIAILATVVFVALDPVTRFADARNSRRWSDVNNILTAVSEYTVDNNGTLPSGITTTEKQLGSCTTGGSSACSGAAAGCLDLSSTLAKYLKTMPVDPSAGSTSTTKFSIVSDANNIVTIKACAAENAQVISISR